MSVFFFLETVFCLRRLRNTVRRPIFLIARNVKHGLTCPTRGLSPARVVIKTRTAYVTTKTGNRDRVQHGRPPGVLGTRAQSLSSTAPSLPTTTTTDDDGFGLYGNNARIIITAAPERFPNIGARLFCKCDGGPGEIPAKSKNERRR